MTWVAQDNFVGESPEGAWLTVQKGQAFPDNHPLVRLDRDAAEAAEKDGRSRTPLFAPMDLGEDEKAPAKSQPAKAEEKAPPVKAAPGRKGA
jgi:pyruvate/2-oxoglutarate dehydrogenase complex dihydrolipoamide acyltransferase (E2) component